MKRRPSTLARDRAGRALEAVRGLLAEARRVKVSLAKPLAGTKRALKRVFELEEQARKKAGSIVRAQARIESAIRGSMRHRSRSLEKDLERAADAAEIAKKAEGALRAFSRRAEWIVRIGAGEWVKRRLAKIELVSNVGSVVVERSRDKRPKDDAPWAPRVEVQATGPESPEDLLFAWEEGETGEAGGAGRLVLEMSEAVSDMMELFPFETASKRAVWDEKGKSWRETGRARGRLRFTVTAEPGAELARYMTSPKLLRGSRPELGWKKSVLDSGEFTPRWYRLSTGLPAATVQAVNRIASLIRAGVNVSSVTIDLNLGAFDRRPPRKR